MGAWGDPPAERGRVLCPTARLPSAAPEFGVEEVAFAVAPGVPPEAEHQAAVALAGELGAPGAGCCGHREPGVSPGAGGWAGVTPPSPGSYSPQKGLRPRQP